MGVIEREEEGMKGLCLICVFTITCNKVAKAVKQCSIHFLSVER